MPSCRQWLGLAWTGWHSHCWDGEGTPGPVLPSLSPSPLACDTPGALPTSPHVISLPKGCGCHCQRGSVLSKTSASREGLQVAAQGLPLCQLPLRSPGLPCWVWGQPWDEELESQRGHRGSSPLVGRERCSHYSPQQCGPKHVRAQGVGRKDPEAW